MGFSLYVPDLRYYKYQASNRKLTFILQDMLISQAPLQQFAVCRSV